jgi:NAD(P)H dehydrogenase (quinone)
MTKVLIAFYSRTGSVEALAKAVAEGVRGEGAELRIRRAREVVSPEVMQMAPGWTESAARMNAEYEAPTSADAEWADAIILGSPSRFGVVSSELKAWLDSLGGLWAGGKLVGKVGSAFSSSSVLHGGNEMVIASMWMPLAHLGLILVPTGYADPAMFQAGTPYGATAATGHGRALTAEEQAAATWQGKRVALVAKALRG